MSIEGVNSKIMLHKVTEFSKEASNQLKQAEVMQSNVNKQAQAEARMQSEHVNDVFETSQVYIQREKERRQQDQKEKQETEETAREKTAEANIPASPNVGIIKKKIDIRI